MSGDSKELLESLDLEQWFERDSRSYKMTRGASGMQINARECPACGDMRWRTYLNAETGIGNCFVCNARFNKGAFIHRTLGFDPDDKSPAGKKHWKETFAHVKEALSEQGWRPRRTTMVAVEAGEVVLPASFPLPTPEGKNLVYLENRGIKADVAAFFHLRCCVAGKFWYDDEENGTKHYQIFDGRVIIPVYDLDGKMKTFQGRDITGVHEGQKYLFPKGLPGTGRYLYNGQTAGKARRVCLGEGAFDVIALKMAFDDASHLRDVIAVGSFGKHLSYGSTTGDDQLGRFIELRRGGLQEVTIMWDGEPKALEAALNAAELLTRVGLRVRIALLPAGRDPNEVVGDVVREAFQNAKEFTPILNMTWRLKNPYS